MKKLTKIKLNQLCKAELNSREMAQLTGGLCCGCGCHGPSSTKENQDANAASGYGSIGGNKICWCWDGGAWVKTETK